MRAYRGAIVVMAGLMVVVGCALIVRGAIDSKPLGLVLGALFVALGVGRIYLLRRR
jgi:hypothetical protein